MIGPDRPGSPGDERRPPPVPALLLALAATFLLTSTPAVRAAETRLAPADFRYLGAFRLPDEGERPKTFAWGAGAMTFRPDGDPGGAPDRHPGSLFVMGHDRMPYGELPDGNQVAEITIPAPVRAKQPGALPKARFLQRFHDVAKGRFKGRNELPRTGMAYLETPGQGPLIHLAWGQHMQPPEQIPTHAWISPTLSRPAFTGGWYIGRRSDYAVNGYLFEIPEAWAAAHVGGRRLATGRYRDGGWSGMGPTLFAYRPWTEPEGTPAAPGTRLKEIALLHYESSRNTERIERALTGYQHADEWEGGAWITTRSGKTAVLFAGTKSTGAKYWYGFVNPAGPGRPCVAGDFVGQFPVCRLANGKPCPRADLKECKGHNGFRGWWSSRFEAQFTRYAGDGGGLLHRVSA
ncbi:MAG: hypothetical protein QF893_23835, partial [Alphaproteobacteria bacterium]|nr:hypothetical protein [Alphaproteobacteria bacterium]